MYISTIVIAALAGMSQAAPQGGTTTTSYPTWDGWGTSPSARPTPTSTSYWISTTPNPNTWMSDKSTTLTSSRTTASTSSRTYATATSTGLGGDGSLPKWAQCGGLYFPATATCVLGTTCVVINPWYSQCL